jgi:hypothetical protein
MKTVCRFCIFFMTATVLLGSVSCSSDDEGSGGGESGYFEITFRGVTKTYNLDVISQSGNGEFNFVTSAEIPDVDFMLTTYADLNQLVAAPVGEYRFCANTEPQNFDFDISCIVDGAYLHGTSGKHTVTSVKRRGAEVWIEGNFNGKVATGWPVSGRYKVAVW